MKGLRIGLAIVVAGAVAGWTLPLSHAHADVATISDYIILRGNAAITADGATNACGPDVLDGQVAGTDTPSVDVRGGCGNFNFTSSTCLGASADDAGGLLPPKACTVSANGTFLNTVCGTGSAAGTATVVAGDDAGSTANFSITFVAGIGILTGSSTTSPPDTDTAIGVVLLTAAGVPADKANAQMPDCADGFGIVSATVFRS